MGSVRCHKVTSDSEESMRGEALAQAIQSDIEKGLVPFLVRLVAAFLHFCYYCNLIQISSSLLSPSLSSAYDNTIR